MSVRRMIAATALSAGLVAGVPAAAAAQSPPEVAPTSVVRVAGTNLSRTGTDTMPMVVAGTGLAAAGAVLVVAARRRRAAAVPA